MLFNQFDGGDMFGGGGGGGGGNGDGIDGFGANSNGYQATFQDKSNGVGHVAEVGETDRSIKDFRPLPQPQQQPQQGFQHRNGFQPPQQEQPSHRQNQGGVNQNGQPNGFQQGQGGDMRPLPQQFQLDPRSIQELSNAVRQPQGQQQQPQLSDQEFRQRTFYPTVGQEFANTVLGSVATPQQVSALQVFADGIIKHVQTVNELALRGWSQQYDQRLESGFAPLQRMQQEQVQAQLQTAIETSYPSLTQFKQVIPQAVSILKAQGYRAQGDPQAVIAQVASTAEQIIRSVQPQFSLQTQQQSPNGSGFQGGGRNMPQMNPMMGNGGAGSSGGGQGATPNKSWQGLF